MEKGQYSKHLKIKDGDPMRLLFIRHGDPDYENDRLNETGLKEARALSSLLKGEDLGDCYASPLGRAQETAAIALGRALPGARGRDAAAACGDKLTTLDWLQEFPSRVDASHEERLLSAYYFKTLPDGSPKPHIVWDMYPSYYDEHPQYADRDLWRTTLVALNSPMVSDYDRVTAAFDALLAKYGYVREGRHYRVEKESRMTLTFFCHFGITSVLLSHLWNVSPFVPLHSLCMPTSSVTEVFTEERQQGFAHFRTTRIGDTTHLTMAGLGPTRPPHCALFTDIYSDASLRHD